MVCKKHVTFTSAGLGGFPAQQCNMKARSMSFIQTATPVGDHWLLSLFHDCKQYVCTDSPSLTLSSVWRTSLTDRVQPCWKAFCFLSCASVSKYFRMFYDRQEKQVSWWLLRAVCCFSKLQFVPLPTWWQPCPTNLIVLACMVPWARTRPHHSQPPPIGGEKTDQCPCSPNVGGGSMGAHKKIKNNVLATALCCP